MFKKFLEKNFGFGFLGFSNFGEVSNFSTFSLQKHLYGVQIESEIDLEIFEYEISLAYLHGLTDASTNHMFLWNMELEF